MARLVEIFACIYDFQIHIHVTDKAMDHTQCDSSDNEAQPHFIIMNNQKLETSHFSLESEFVLSFYHYRKHLQCTSEQCTLLKL